jgi:hypothetical protein
MTLDGVERPAELGLRLWQAFRGRDWGSVRAMVHPEARIATALQPDPLVGRDQAVDVWQAAVEEGRFDPRPVGFIELDDTRVLLIGSIRPASVERQADALVLTFKGGLLWRSRYYASADEAQRSQPEDPGESGH